MPTHDKFSLTGYQNCEYPVNDIQHIQCAQALPYEENANLPEGLLPSSTEIRGAGGDSGLYEILRYKYS